MDVFDEEILSKQLGWESGGSVDVAFGDAIAIIYMRCPENRLNYSFVSKMHDALTKVEQ